MRGLRVADASIMPFIVNANIHAPCIIIREKCAAMILEDAAKQAGLSYEKSRYFFAPAAAPGRGLPVLENRQNRIIVWRRGSAINFSS